MPEKLDPLKLAEKLGAQLGAEMEQELKNLEKASGGKEADLGVAEPVVIVAPNNLDAVTKQSEAPIGSQSVENKILSEAVEEKPKVTEVAEAKKDETEKPKEKEKERLSAEQLKKEVEKTRAEYIKSEADAKKADKSSSKLRRLRELLFGGKKEGVDVKKDTAEKEKEATKKVKEEKKNAYEEAKKVFAKGLYDEKMRSFEKQVKMGGKDNGPMTLEEQEKTLAMLKFEVLASTILDEKKTLNEAKFLALPEKERSLCVKAMARYGQLPQWSKVLISASVATGVTVAFSSGAGFAMVGGVFAWKALRAGAGATAGLLAGKGYNWVFDKIVDVKNIKSNGEKEIIAEIKECLAKQGGQKNDLAENKTENREEEFEKWFSGLSASTNQKLDDLAVKEKRILLGKAIGQGVVIAGVAGLTSMGMEKIGTNLGLISGASLIRPDVLPEDASKAGAINTQEEALKVNATDTESLRAKEALNLKIGTRGPEGAIIDNFKAKPELAKAFGWNGKTPINEWAGTKAHQLWLSSIEADLKNPKIAAGLAEHGYQANPEGYAKAMHKIGKGFVSLDSQGHVYLSDNTSFLKTALLSETADITAGDGTGPEAPGGKSLLSAEDLKIKEKVTHLVDPEILKDETFKAAAKVPLGKILESVPPEAYRDKYALSRYWHSLSGAGVKTPDLPGSSWLGLTYDDFKKYSEMAKFLRENAENKTIEGLKKVTVKEFLEKYGGDLGKAK